MGYIYDNFTNFFNYVPDRIIFFLVNYIFTLIFLINFTLMYL